MQGMRSTVRSSRGVGEATPADRNSTKRPAAGFFSCRTADAIACSGGTPVDRSSASAGGSARTSVRSRRLHADAEQMASAFRNFPLVRVFEANGDPPELYRIEYLVRGLVPRQWRSAAAARRASRRNPIDPGLPTAKPQVQNAHADFPSEYRAGVHLRRRSLDGWRAPGRSGGPNRRNDRLPGLQHQKSAGWRSGHVGGSQRPNVTDRQPESTATRA